MQNCKDLTLHGCREMGGLQFTVMVSLMLIPPQSQPAEWKIINFVGACHLHNIFSNLQLSCRQNVSWSAAIIQKNSDIAKMKWKFPSDGSARVYVCDLIDGMINACHEHSDQEVKYRKFYHDWWQCLLGHCLYYARMVHLSYLCFLQAFHIKLMNGMVQIQK